jgi:hypothetical protein
MAAMAALSVALIALGGIAWGVGAAGPDEPGAARPPMPAGPSMPSGPKKPAIGRDGTAAETVTFHGRVVDPEGRPVAGATLHLAGAGLAGSAFRTVRATSGPDGRFRIARIGRGRIALLQLDDPAIERANFDVRTWPGAPIRLPASRSPRSYAPRTIYGATFEHVAGPTRPVEGVVRDRETGRPLADIMVYAHSASARPTATIRSMTDARGRYRLVGLPLGREGQLVAVPACDLGALADWFRIDPRLPADRCPPYFPEEVTVPKTSGKEPIHLDIALTRGVRITGRIVDRSTGKPVRGRVEYFDFDDDPHRNVDPDVGRPWRLHFTNVDGIFRLVVPPGPGVLAADAFGPYVRATGAEAIKARRPDWLSHLRRRLRSPGEFHAFGWIEPALGDSSLTQDLKVVPGGRGR